MKQRFAWRVGLTASVTAALLAFPGATLASSATNNNTGSDSTAEARVDETSSTSITSTNTSNTTNTFVFDLTSGDNEADDNTGDGTVESGDIAINARATTESNTNTGITVPAHDPGDAHASNSNTGSDSDADATINVNHSLTINANNFSDTINSADISANTGNNSASDNTGDGTVRSGRIIASVSFNTESNTRTNPTPAPTPSNGGGGGATPTPSTSPGGGGTTTTTTTTTDQGGGTSSVTTTTALSSVPTVEAQGGGEFPRVLQEVFPREGVGGGFFPAGSNWIVGYILIVIGTALLIFSDKIRPFIQRHATSTEITA